MTSQACPLKMHNATLVRYLNSRDLSVSLLCEPSPLARCIFPLNVLSKPFSGEGKIPISSLPQASDNHVPANHTSRWHEFPPESFQLLPEN